MDSNFKRGDWRGTDGSTCQKICWWTRPGSEAMPTRGQSTLVTTLAKPQLPCISPPTLSVVLPLSKARVAGLCPGKLFLLQEGQWLQCG